MRVLGLGLIIASMIAYKCWPAYCEFVLRDSAAYVFNMTIQKVSEPASTQLGSAAILPAIFLMLCIGSGLLMAELLFTVLGSMGYFGNAAVRGLVTRTCAAGQRHHV